jgi:hypothetical protein
MTPEEAVAKANARFHRMGPFVQEEHGDDVENWQYKWRSTCLNCKGMIVHSAVPDEPESVMGFPIDDDCGILIDRS